jgi:hypothetical protein
MQDGKATTLQQRTRRARAKLLRIVLENGFVTNSQARRFFAPRGAKNFQTYYHLTYLQRAGLLRHESYDRWVRGRRLTEARVQELETL